MNRKLIALIAVLSACLMSGPAMAGPKHGKDSYEYAKVVRVEPVVHTVRVSTPRRDCWDEEVVRYDRSVQYRGRASAANTILGGILGGVAGSRFGKGKGQDGMIVAGTIMGTSLARQLAHQPRTVSRPYSTTEQHCQVRNEYYEDERVDGYRVTYRYHGQEYTQRMAYDPGSRVRIRLDVHAVDY